ncbi:hypothetical protein L5M18_22075 [Shewanella sp. SM20]|uniref:hypothetical protein n=1 Tax=Shewanella TaxID=22 RepID=UPI0021D8FCDA|nr:MULTISPECIES: hypothetical protein [unclassified Shewanella]MCU8071373.1 hypothetical protein [Shewanella sp. SM32]MCU8094199.1 hypothetical protein [Shewanella sp. SM20]
MLKISDLVQQYIDNLAEQTDFNHWHTDCRDDAYCAVEALFQHQRPQLMATPTEDVTTEGWIYVPKECLTSIRKR